MWTFKYIWWFLINWTSKTVKSATKNNKEHAGNIKYLIHAKFTFSDTELLLCFYIAQSADTAISETTVAYWKQTMSYLCIACNKCLQCLVCQFYSLITRTRKTSSSIYQNRPQIINWLKFQTCHLTKFCKCHIQMSTVATDTKCSKWNAHATKISLLLKTATYIATVLTNTAIPQIHTSA